MAKRKLATDSPDKSAITQAKKARLDAGATIVQQKPDTESVEVSQPPEAGPSTAPASKLKVSKQEKASSTSNSNPSRAIRKLAPSRPFPVVPTSVSATGPKSAFHEGKNMICITRKTSLAAYLRKCKRLIMEDGYKTLHLSALGAAIPLLATLSVSVPAILPYPEDVVKIEVKTGSVELVDEIIPEDEDEDISTNTREKSSMTVVIHVGDDVNTQQARKSVTAVKRGKRWKGKTKTMPASVKAVEAGPAKVVVQEQEQDDVDY